MSVLSEAYAVLSGRDYLTFIVRTDRIWHEYLQQQSFDGSEESNRLYNEYQAKMRTVLETM